MNPTKQTNNNKLKYLLPLCSLFGLMVQLIQSPKLETSSSFNTSLPSYIPLISKSYRVYCTGALHLKQQVLLEFENHSSLH